MEFKTELDQNGQVTAPINELTVISQWKEKKTGIFSDETGKKGSHDSKNIIAGPCTVIGQISAVDNNNLNLQVRVGHINLSCKLAVNTIVHVKTSDLSMASKGDNISIEGTRVGETVTEAKIELAETPTGLGTKTVPEEPISWWSDFLAFRKAITDALDAVDHNHPVDIRPEELAGRSAVASFHGQEVQWKLTFLGVNSNKELKFQECISSMGKGTPLGKNIDSITIYLEADPNSLTNWRAIPPKTIVTCQAIISDIQPEPRFGANKQFAAWRITVFLTKAQPIN